MNTGANPPLTVRVDRRTHTLPFADQKLLSNSSSLIRSFDKVIYPVGSMGQKIFDTRWMGHLANLL
jgi:hypothetical protein